MGHTGLEPCAKTTGNTPLCEESGAESGAVVALDPVLQQLIANWEGLPEHIKSTIKTLLSTGDNTHE